MNKWKMFLCLYIVFIFLSSEVVFSAGYEYEFDKEVATKNKILAYLNREDVSNNKKIKYILDKSQKIYGFVYKSIVWDILVATAITTVDVALPTDIGRRLDPKLVNELLSKLDRYEVFFLVNKLQENGWIQLESLDSSVKSKWMSVYESRILCSDYRAKEEISEVLSNKDMSFNKKITNILDIIKKLDKIRNEFALEMFEAFFNIDPYSNIKSREDGSRYIDKRVVNAILNKIWNLSNHDYDYNYGVYELVSTLKDRGWIDFQDLYRKFQRRWYRIDAQARNNKDLEAERDQRQRDDRYSFYYYYTTDMLNTSNTQNGGCKNLFNGHVE